MEKGPRRQLLLSVVRGPHDRRRRTISLGDDVPALASGVVRIQDAPTNHERGVVQRLVVSAETPHRIGLTENAHYRQAFPESFIVYVDTTSYDAVSPSHPHNSHASYCF